jgi:hypothetical protein
MPLDTSRVLELTPVVTGSMVEVPPDLPDGHWSGPCNVRDGIAEDGREKYFRLFLEWTATEDIAGTNPSSVGGSATHMVTFYPESHKNANMTKTEVKKL